MRRLLFALTLAVYGFSAMELHEWVRVPQVVLHFLEQHTSEEFHDLFHGEHTGTVSTHDEHDHDPFDEDCPGEFCACSGMIAVVPANCSFRISVASLTSLVGATPSPMALNAFTGNVWNPPKA